MMNQNENTSCVYVLMCAVSQAVEANIDYEAPPQWNVNLVIIYISSYLLHFYTFIDSGTWRWQHPLLHCQIYSFVNEIDKLFVVALNRRWIVTTKFWNLMARKRQHPNGKRNTVDINECSIRWRRQQQLPKTDNPNVFQYKTMPHTNLNMEQ